MQRLLIPTDFSRNAENAFRFALHLSTALKAEIVLLHVYHIPDLHSRGLNNTLKELYSDLEKEGRQQLVKHIPRYNMITRETGVDDSSIKHILAGGNIIQAIKSTIARQDIDFLIMGTQGHSQIEAFFLGSHAAHMLENSSIPVLAIPPNMKPSKKIQEFALATDFSAEAYLAMKFMLRITKIMKTKLSSFYVGKHNNKAEEEKWLNTFSEEILTHDFIKSDDFMSATVNYFDTHDLDAIALTTHKSESIFNLFNREKAKKLMFTKTVPVLGLPEKFLKNQD